MAMDKAKRLGQLLAKYGFAFDPSDRASVNNFGREDSWATVGQVWEYHIDLMEAVDKFTNFKWKALTKFYFTLNLKFVCILKTLSIKLFNLKHPNFEVLNFSSEVE